MSDMTIIEREYNNVIARNLRRLAVEKDKTQQDIANALNVSKATVSLWFNGKNIPRMDKIDALCQYLNVKRSDIMEGQEVEKAVFVISEEDMKLIQAFKQASDERKKIILDILNINN